MAISLPTCVAKVVCIGWPSHTARVRHNTALLQLHLVFAILDLLLLVFENLQELLPLELICLLLGDSGLLGLGDCVSIGVDKLCPLRPQGV